ncbi:MAG TPA: NAD(P)-binding domain-containing protein [Ktedonobacterales bacterium]|nr:NAD(P)-binding domain-containing protein [Ktedonobacterales bacterium]
MATTEIDARPRDHSTSGRAQTYDTIVIGGGQAGLATGYFLKRHQRDFIILDANERIGDAWRNRWDSLRMFTYARFDGLAGMPFPAPAYAFPTKDEMADYLEAYAARFELPVRTSVVVDRLTRQGERFEVTAGDMRFEAKHVVVAMSNHQKPRLPSFASALDSSIVQLHSSEYRNPSQLRAGGILVVGAGNSGAEIALELARSHAVWLSGRDTGHIPIRIERRATQILVMPLFRAVFHHVLTVDTPIGRKLRPKFTSGGDPLIRIKPRDLVKAGIERVPRAAGVRDGLPVLDDGRVLAVTNVIWCTGYHPGFSWIELPILAGDVPIHERGIVTSEPGLYFVGLEFLYAKSSVMVHGVSRDAERVVNAIAMEAGGVPALAGA